MKPEYTEAQEKMRKPNWAGLIWPTAFILFWLAVLILHP